MMDKISFEHFFIEVKESVASKDLKFINPNAMAFFKMGHIYLALSQPKNKLIVNYALNTGKDQNRDWTADIKKEAEISGCESIIFYTSEHNKIVQNIAARWKMEKIDTIKDFYGVGEASFVYELKIK